MDAVRGVVVGVVRGQEDAPGRRSASHGCSVRREGGVPVTPGAANGAHLRHGRVCMVMDREMSGREDGLVPRHAREDYGKEQAGVCRRATTSERSFREAMLMEMRMVVGIGSAPEFLTFLLLSALRSLVLDFVRSLTLTMRGQRWPWWAQPARHPHHPYSLAPASPASIPSGSHRPFLAGLWPMPPSSSRSIFSGSRFLSHPIHHLLHSRTRLARSVGPRPLGRTLLHARVVVVPSGGAHRQHGGGHRASGHGRHGPRPSACRSSTGTSRRTRGTFSPSFTPSLRSSRALASGSSTPSPPRPSSSTTAAAMRAMSRVTTSTMRAPVATSLL